jgi:transposase
MEFWTEACVMDQAGEVLSARRSRRRRSLAEKRRIVDLTLQPGSSVSLVARANGVNANQVFAWRRAFERGGLAETSVSPTSLLPVTVSAESEVAQPSSLGERSMAVGSIHIEFEGRALISIEGGADPTLVRVILESLRK